MKRIMYILLVLMILLKILFNGIGIYGISIWFYIPFIGIFLIIIYMLNNKNNSILRGYYKKYIIYCFIMLLIMFLVYLLNNSIIKNYIIVLQFLSMIVLSIMTYISINTEKQFRVISHTIIFATMISAIIGICQYLKVDFIIEIQQSIQPFKATFIDDQRITGMSSTVITFTYELIVGITLLFNELIISKNKVITKILITISLLILITTIIINQTRSAIIAVILNLLLLIHHYYKGRINIKTLLLFIVIPIFAFCFSIIIINNFNIYTRFHIDNSSSVRIPMLITGLKYALINPFGTGDYNLSINTIQNNYSSYISNVILNNTTHNHLMNILVYYGFIGLAIALKIYSIIIKTFRQIKIKSSSSNYLFSYFLCIVGYTLNSMTHNPGILNADPIIWIIISLFFVGCNYYKNNCIEGVKNNEISIYSTKISYKSI